MTLIPNQASSQMKNLVDDRGSDRFSWIKRFKGQCSTAGAEVVLTASGLNISTSCSGSNDWEAYVDLSSFSVGSHEFTVTHELTQEVVSASKTTTACDTAAARGRDHASGNGWRIRIGE